MCFSFKMRRFSASANSQQEGPTARLYTAAYSVTYIGFCVCRSSVRFRITRRDMPRRQEILLKSVIYITVSSPALHVNHMYQVEETRPDQMEETRWEGQNFSEVVAPQEEEDEETWVINCCNKRELFCWTKLSISKVTECVVLGGRRIIKKKEQWWKQTIRGETELLGENPVPIQHLSPQIQNGLGWDQIRPSRLQTAK
jgi:hypothetical protein